MPGERLWECDPVCEAPGASLMQTIVLEMTLHHLCNRFARTELMLALQMNISVGVPQDQQAPAS